MFKPVSPKVDFQRLEETILNFWKKEDIFKKTLEKNRSKKRFVFYEGPPTANGKPGVHHVLARSFKDIVCRYKQMSGFLVERKGGWDTHGLPVELEVEKSLGISGKQEILKLKKTEKDSIIYFNGLCKKSVFKYVEDWKSITDRIGFWIDMEHPYATLDNKYIESVWWVVKQIANAGLLYEDYKVVPYCPRCETSLSSHELALGYKDLVPDPSIYVKFELLDEPGTFLLGWTTTPWTLPGNVAIAIGKNIKYVKVKIGEERFILAKSRVKDLIRASYTIEKEISAQELVGKRYKPPYQFLSYSKPAHFVTTASFAREEEGTGIVHTAVMYGEEDFELGKKIDLPRKHIVNTKGEFIGEAGPFAGKFVKKADKEIIDDLKKRNLLFRSETITHTYPFCWRCETPVLYYALTSWFIETTGVKKELISNNEKINWIPKHVKKGRMGEWLESLKDWNLSRSRFWGTPLPIWRCLDGHVKVVGSAKEIGLDINDPEADLHKPFVDEIFLKCDECGRASKRVPEVIDVWFDSGAMPFAQWHYPFENKQVFQNNYPADYICEAMDQTRGWFFTLLAESTLLEKAKKVGVGYSYKNVISLGLVLDEKGQKMSKSRGNVVDPWEVINSVGSDAMRWYFFTAAVAGNEYRFSSRLVREVKSRFILTLWNVYVFFVTYARIDKWTPANTESKPSHPLDKWVLSQLDNLIATTNKDLDAYDITSASRRIEDFVVRELSTWYLRRSRNRVGPTAQDRKDKEAFYDTLYEVLVSLTRLLAPFVPFVAEEIYKGLVDKLSVHLEDWPKDHGRYKKEYEVNMQKAREIAAVGLGQRKKLGIKVRQPLNKISIPEKFRVPSNFLQLASEELNVRKAEFVKSEEFSLDTRINSELKAEGKAREIIRAVQEARKKAGVSFDQKVVVYLPDWPKEFEGLIMRETLAKKLVKSNSTHIEEN